MHAIAPLFLVLLSSPSGQAREAKPLPSTSLLEEAAASWEGPTRLRLQPAPGALVGVGDGNGDGLPDIVVIASRGRGAWILPGDGKGGLGGMQPLDRPIGPHGVGDLDGDGIPEQVYGGAFGSEAVVLPGKPQTAAPALAADLDGDGSADLATVEESGLRIVLPGAGRETRVPLSPDAVSLLAADLDGDGAPDLLVADAHRDEIAVLRGDARGGFRPAGGYRVWLRPFSMAAGDLDGDGAVDAVVSDQCGSNLALLRGDGRGGFADPILLQSSGPAPRGTEGGPVGPAVTSVTLAPTTLPRRSGTASMATVTLDGPAPAEGCVLRLTSSDPDLVAMATEVTVPAGETSVSFPVTPADGPGRGRKLAYLATLTAAVGSGKPASATLTVSPE